MPLFNLYATALRMIGIGHEHYMDMAIRQAQNAADVGEVPAGCIIVDCRKQDGEPVQTVIGRAHNQTELLKDPTAHAEMLAITQATSVRKDWRLTDTILYVTKEPCVMCAGAIILARIPIVVFGTPDPKRGGAVSCFNVLKNDSLNHKCEVISGIKEDICRGMLQEFFRQKRVK